jgi:chorismate dehydratase
MCAQGRVPEKIIRPASKRIHDNILTGYGVDKRIASPRITEPGLIASPGPWPATIYTGLVCVPAHPLRIAAIRFVNPAPLMWDFEHPPLNHELASRYQIDYMLPSECADRLAAGSADIGLVPIASLGVMPQLRVLPGCTIASKRCVRSLLLVRRANQPLARLRTVAADTASRTTIAHARILFHHWGNPSVEFVPMPGDLDVMLDRAEAAIVIGDPALLSLEERANREERTGEELVYHDLAEEWRAVTGLPFVSAVWGVAPGTIASSATAWGNSLEEIIAKDLVRSRDHGLRNIDALATEWAARLPLPEDVIHAYFTSNIHYILDEECVEGMRCFFRKAAELGILPAYDFSMNAMAV